MLGHFWHWLLADPFFLFFPYLESWCFFQIREDVKTGVYVENLREECVCTMKDVTKLLMKVCELSFFCYTILFITVPERQVKRVSEYYFTSLYNASKFIQWRFVVLASYWFYGYLWSLVEVLNSDSYKAMGFLFHNVFK